jgi:DNA adenine methylase
METKDSGGESKRNFVHTPLRYPGHQIYALDTLLSLIPEHQFYVEPFCGGASVFFGKRKVRDNWLNDIDEELIGTYEAIRDQPKELVAVLSKEPVSEQRHHYFKNDFIPKNNFETAVRWFYLNRTSKLETMSRFWEYDAEASSVPINWNERILECSKKLEGVRLTFGDFEQVINRVPNGAFLFIAPPYSIHHSSAQNRQHKFPFEREAHFRLAEALKLKDRKVKFLLTYNDNDEIRQMYSWGDHITIANLPNKPPQKGEIVIMNY